MAFQVNKKKSWYIRGWDDYDNKLALGKGLWTMHVNGESSIDRNSYKRGWRDALVCDLADAESSPAWMKKELGL